MDERKRSFDYTDSAVDNKKSRFDYEDRKFRTRILVNKLEYSRIIGRGGHSVTNIRNITGAVLKGTNVDDELTMLAISGTFRQIIDAFELISEILHNIIYPSFESVQPIMFSLKFLVDDDKVGKIIGMNGVVIQNMKARSGATDIRMQRQSQELFGQTLRLLTIEGDMRAMRSAHYLLLEITGNIVEDREMEGGRGGDPLASYPKRGIVSLDPLTPQELSARRLHVDAVRQFGDLRTYLAAFGLELHAFKEGKLRYCNYELEMAAQHPRDLFTSPEFLQRNPHLELMNAKYSLEFAIDTIRYKIGRVIGKGSIILRNIQNEFQVYIHISKEEEVDGVRKVTIKGDIEENLPLARDHMMKLLTEVKKPPVVKVESPK